MLLKNGKVFNMRNGGGLCFMENELILWDGGITDIVSVTMVGRKETQLWLLW